MNPACIITVAITGSLPQKQDNPAVPISVAEQIESTHAAFDAGASLVHLHVRNDDGTPTSSPERFEQVMSGIRRHCPGIIVQFSTGGRSGAGRERGAHLALKPDMGSLATGSVNFPTRVYDNAPDLVEWLAAEMKAHGIKPLLWPRNAGSYPGFAFTDDGALLRNTVRATRRAARTEPKRASFVSSIVVSARSPSMSRSITGSQPGPR